MLMPFISWARDHFLIRVCGLSLSPWPHIALGAGLLQAYSGSCVSVPTLFSAWNALTFPLFRLCLRILCILFKTKLTCHFIQEVFPCSPSPSWTTEPRSMSLIFTTCLCQMFLPADVPMSCVCVSDMFIFFCVWRAFWISNSLTAMESNCALTTPKAQKKY